MPRISNALRARREKCARNLLKKKTTTISSQNMTSNTSIDRMETENESHIAEVHSVINTTDTNDNNNNHKPQSKPFDADRTFLDLSFQNASLEDERNELQQTITKINTARENAKARIKMLYESLQLSNSIRHCAENEARITAAEIEKCVTEYEEYKKEVAAKRAAKTKPPPPPQITPDPMTDEERLRKAHALLPPRHVIEKLETTDNV